MNIDWNIFKPSKPESPEDSIDREAVERSNYEGDMGPEVGRLTLEAKETKEQVPGIIRAELITEDEYAGCVQFKIISQILPEHGEEVQESVEGFIILRVDKPREGYYASEKYKSQNDPEQKNDPEAQYGVASGSGMPSKVFIENMVSGYYDGGIFSSPEFYPSPYSGLGILLHQIASEWSRLNGCEGRVQLEVAYQSLGFHERFGFVAQDVLNPDGSVHHLGASVHDDLGKSRAKAAQGWQDKSGGGKSGSQGEKDKYVRLFGDRARDFGYIKSKVYMYLPPEIIRREKERAAQEPRLAYSAATIRAMLDQYRYRSEAREIKPNMERYGFDDGYDQYREENVGDKLFAAGDIEAANQHFRKAFKIAESRAEKAFGSQHSPQAWDRAGNMAKKMRDEETAKSCWREAVNAATNLGQAREAAEYRAKISGSEDG